MHGLIRKNKHFSPDSIQAAKKALQKMQREMDGISTFDEIRKLIGDAEAIKAIFRNIVDVKQEAEWTILIGNQRIGNEIEKVPKAAGGDRRSKLAKRLNLKSGRTAVGIPGWSRSRFLQLARVERNKLLRAAQALWKVGKDATMRAVLAEGLYGDFKKKRAIREVELSEKIKALPTKKYGVILADPEWKFETHSDKGKVLTSAEKHYSTSDLDDIKRRKPPAASDCVLFLWGTVPMLPQALEVMEAWGFKYVSNVAWDKEKTGTGYWFMNQHEHLLVGTRGRVVPPAMGQQWPSVIRERSTKHSRKPEKSYKMIEEYYPNIPKIEMNLRGRPRAGWDGWGNEAQ